jgi:organic radical activating enzyme
MKTNELIAATVMKHLIPIPISQRRMVITGGEPLLQQKAIVSLLSILSKELILEIETNGTIIPNTFLQSRVDQFNCSPKLRSSGMLFNKRLNPKAIQVFKDVGSIFKFVVSDDKDIEEMECMIESCHIDLSKVWLMPAAASRKQLIEKSEYIWRYCSAKGYNFSPRLQVLAFDLKTGI